MSAVLEDSTKFPEPRPFQVTAHNALREGFKGGHKNQLVMAPTGSGKTYLGLRICNEAMQRGKRAVFLCDRTTLINQTSAVADQYGLYNHGIVQAQHWRRRPQELLQIASVQTIAKREFWPECDVLVVDECFVAGTEISTPTGMVNIEDLVIGDTVYNGNGVGLVKAVSKKPSTNIITLRLSNGNKIRCTETHPFFTPLGWRPAGSLVGSQLFQHEDVRILWEGNDSDLLECRGESKGDSGSAMERTEFLRQILRDEVEQPNAVTGDSSENIYYVESDGSSSEGSRREWRPDTGDSGFCFRDPWGGMGCGVSNTNLQVVQAGIPIPLQTRLSESIAEDLHRTRRAQPRSIGAARAGQKKRCSFTGVWVESIEVEEQGRTENVYNLSIGGHPSYFANGVLVHNCHTTYKAWTEFAMATKATVIGLSATPFTTGLGKIFSNLVNATTMHELTKSGVLVPMRIFSCSKPDMTGAKTAGGEWTDKAAEERGLTIIGDVVTQWIQHAEGRKTIVFGSTIKHCQELCGEFISNGIMAAVFTADTTAEEREQLLKEYRKADSTLKVLISVEALAKGFDVPDVECICDARPLRKSLSTAIQMWGRGLRSFPGKKDCYLLDFSGNIIRFFEDFNDVFFNGLDALDDGEKLDKQVREKEEFEDKGCPQCGYKPFYKRCMSCGFEKISQRLTEVLPGEMKEIFIGEGSKKKKLADSPENLWHQLVTYARFHSKPETAKGRAWHLFLDITGQKSKWDFDKAPHVEITKNVFNKIQSMNTAWKKGKQNG